MPRSHPAEFRRGAVEVANQRDGQGNRVQPVATVAGDLGISKSCLRRWMDRAEIDVGHREGLTSVERKELVELRRRITSHSERCVGTSFGRALLVSLRGQPGPAEGVHAGRPAVRRSSAVGALVRELVTRPGGGSTRRRA
jgi:transposase